MMSKRIHNVVFFDESSSSQYSDEIDINNLFDDIVSQISIQVDSINSGTINLTVKCKADDEATSWATQSVVKSEGFSLSNSITSAGVYFIDTTGLGKVRIENNGTIGGVRACGALICE